MNWRNRFYQFMQGRYGSDELSRFTSGAALVLIIVSMITARHSGFSGTIDLLGLLLVGWTCFRMFSKNMAARARENHKFLDLTANIRRRIGKEKYMMEQRKTNHIYTCPGCGQKIRVPKGKGRIEIRCPKCGEKFIKNS